jgi:DNA-directed RNA polymerase specialized sigma24 family protein
MQPSVPSEIDFGELAVRLAGYGLRTFAEFGLGGRSATVPGVGLSVEDFVWNVLSEYAEGTLAYEAERGELFSLLARALRNDIIDALRKAAHSREEARSPLPRENRSENGPPALDELPIPGMDIDQLLSEDRYRERMLAAFAGEPDLAEVVRVVLDSDLAKPREIAEALGISVADFQNRKKRLRRRLVEYHAVEVTEA